MDGRGLGSILSNEVRRFYNLLVFRRKLDLYPAAAECDPVEYTKLRDLYYFILAFFGDTACLVNC